MQALGPSLETMSPALPITVTITIGLLLLILAAVAYWISKWKL